MELETRNKLHAMMYSYDREIATLGFDLLVASISGIKEYNMLRGTSVKGKSFFPSTLKFQVKKLRNTLRSSEISKKEMRLKIMENV